MTNYYIEKDNKIIFVDTDLQRLQNTIALGEYSTLEIQETERPIVNFEFADTPEYIAKQEQKQAEIQALKSITKRQLLIWLYINKQMKEADILSAIDAITDEDKKYLATISYNGTNTFYYGNEYLQMIAQSLSLSIDERKKMFDEAGQL